MNIVVKGKHVKENKAIEEFALKKAEKFAHYFHKIVKVEIELRTETGRKGKDSDFIADILVKVPNHTFKVSDQERDLYKAIDRSVRRMIEVLKREKEKHKKKEIKHIKKGLIERFSFGDAFHSINKKLFRRN